jgi:dTDP-4-amino-4,6-dideoxygalactose transaminase
MEQASASSAPDVTPIPFLDLTGTHQAIAGELVGALEAVLGRGRLILGPELDAFEAEFAAYCGARHCIGVGNGLDALHLVLRAMGIGPGDEVIVPAQTFIATWLAVSHAGAKPVPVDVEQRTGNIDPSLVANAITARTRAILPVHLFGRPADIAGLRRSIGGRDIAILEDAAQAHGASIDGRRVGGLGNAACFSFYPGKNLGALGDGGAVVTDDDALAESLRKLRNYGSAIKYRHESLGWNSRLDELQAAFLRVKLRQLDAWTTARRTAAADYLARLSGIPGLALPETGGSASSVWHLFVVRTPRREALLAHLAARGIGTLIHYPVPPHRQPCYASDYAGQHFPEAEAWAAEALSLPLWPGVPTAPVAAAIREFFTA